MKSPDTRAPGFLLLIAFVFGVATPGAQASASKPIAGSVPGVIVHQLPVPSLAQRLAGQAVYTTSPSIAVLPDGAYVLTFNTFGSGSGASTSGTTFVYRSDDRGAGWENIATLAEMKRGSLFVHPGGDLYLFGYRAAPGDILIRRSLDGGHTWTEPQDGITGLLRQGTFGGTPNRPVIYGDRVWFAISGRRLISAPLNADLLNAGSWTLTKPAEIKNSPIKGELVITEAQVVASDTVPPVLLPKIGGHPSTVLIRSGSSPDKIRNPTVKDWVELPGGEKKFAAAWDSVSGYFIALTNPVLPQYADSGWPPELIRNVGAMLVSKDLKEWKLAHIFVESRNVDYEAFQYFSFDFEGDDLIVASRTAFSMDGRNPPRGHDSNLITFHRIRNFRSFID